MAVTRRDFLRASGTIAGAGLLSPLLGNVSWAAVDPRTTTRRRLVVIDLLGGNDGLNTVVPRQGANRAVYEQVRPTIKLAADTLLPLDRGGPDGGSLGLHPALQTPHRLYQDDRAELGRPA